MIHHCSSGGDGSGKPPIPTHLTRQIKLARWAHTLQTVLMNAEYETAAQIVACLDAFLNDKTDLAEALEDRIRCKAARQALRDLADNGSTFEDMTEEVQEAIVEAIEKGRDHA